MAVGVGVGAGVRQSLAEQWDSLEGQRTSPAAVPTPAEAVDSLDWQRGLANSLKREENKNNW